ncbi:hypothetical protein JAAARDRAFT_122542 [Jaapia argillacea MUCL 33604]|uniref:RNase H type-1 domain-containing protein n=1 Tax=Jaapia argillacea MUCL 33604 TaxID=933084 RepID=A0A067Q5F3_9AGAM|nr:hypothetical protein JAAARDRAFT_122542 [Jaapia argillacea MUCL 33604]
MAAAKVAAEVIPPTNKLHIETDSKYVLNSLTIHQKKGEDKGYIGMENSELIKATIAKLRERDGPTRLKWVKGHSGHERNEQADRNANEGVQKGTPDVIDLTIPPTLRVMGAKLSTMTQALCYKAIQKIKMKKLTIREHTAENLILAKEAATEAYGRTPTSEKLWKSIRSKDLSWEARVFFWMTIHDAYMVGNKWLQANFSAELQERSECKHCHCLDSMEHILTVCEAPGRAEIWDLVKSLWSMKNQTWNHPTMGIILSCCQADFQDSHGNARAGDVRLFRILIAESARLIWSLQCQRVIPDRQDRTMTLNPRQIHNRWVSMINDRLSLDCKLTNTKKYGKKAMPAGLVKATWSGTLKNERELPDGWTREVGVLVGIEPLPITDEAEG